MYMPKLARFTALDPLPKDGPVLLGRVPDYAYADNNPVNMVDPSGLQAGPPGCPDPVLEPRRYKMWVRMGWCEQGPNNPTPLPLPPKGHIKCLGVSGFAGLYGACSFQVMICFDDCGNPPLFVICAGGGGGAGAAVGGGGFIGSGCLEPGWSGQLTGQIGVGGPFGVGGSVGTGGSGAGGGVGAGAGGAVTLEGCYAL